MMAFWRGRRVLVTGGSGLIGSWLVKDLLVFGRRGGGADERPGTAIGNYAAVT